VHIEKRLQPLDFCFLFYQFIDFIMFFILAKK